MTDSCPECGSDEMDTMSGSSGRVYLVCKECGYSGKLGADEPEEDLDFEQEVQKPMALIKKPIRKIMKSRVKKTKTKKGGKRR